MKDPTTQPSMELSDLRSFLMLMEGLPAVPCPGSPSMLEVPSSPNSNATESTDTSLSASPSPKSPARRIARKRSSDEEEMDLQFEQEVFPPGVASDEQEARKAQRMARNRRAAAASRARKKEHLELLQVQVESLQSENAELRRRLSDATSGGCGPRLLHAGHLDESYATTAPMHHVEAQRVSTRSVCAAPLALSANERSLVSLSETADDLSALDLPPLSAFASSEVH